MGGFQKLRPSIETLEYQDEMRNRDAATRLANAEEAMCDLLTAMQEAADAYRLLSIAGEKNGPETHGRLLAGIEDVLMKIQIAEMWLDNGKLSATEVLEVAA